MKIPLFPIVVPLVSSRVPPLVYSLALAVAVFLLAASDARAEPDWDASMQFRVAAGVETPLVLFGFNPQPEPPPEMIVTQSYDPTTAVQELSGIDPTPFQVFLAAEGGVLTVPPEPILDFDQLIVGYTTQGGQRLSLIVSFSPDGDGDLSTGLSDPLFFNPQPEPPPEFVSTGFQFAFDAVQEGGSAVVSVEIQDDQGAALDLMPVSSPVPGVHPIALLTLVPALLAVAAHRRLAARRA